jgi:hypothetical protein
MHPKQSSTYKFNDVGGVLLQELPIQNILDVMHIERMFQKTF